MQYSDAEHPLKVMGKHKVLVLTEILKITDGMYREFRLNAIV